MDWQVCRLVTGVSSITTVSISARTRHQSVLGLIGGVGADEEDQLADGDLRVGRIELRPHFAVFSEKSSTGSSVVWHRKPPLTL